MRAQDTDGSGSLDLSEVERLAAALGVVLSQASAVQIFAQMDVDGNGHVSLREFEKWWAAHYSNDGYVTSEEENSD